MVDILKYFINNTSVLNIIKKSYEKCYEGEINNMTNGVVSSVEFEGDNVESYVKNTILSKVKESDVRYIFETYTTTSEYQLEDINSLVSFVSNIISKQENINLKKSNISEIKNEIINVINNNIKLNENILSEVTLKDDTLNSIFNAYVSREILNSTKNEITLSQMEIPRGVKILLKKEFNRLVENYNNKTIIQLNEEIAQSYKKLISSMSRDNILAVIGRLFTKANEFYAEFDYDIKSVKQLLQKAVMNSKLKRLKHQAQPPFKGKQSVGIKDYNIDNLLYELINKTPKIGFTEDNLILKMFLQPDKKNSIMVEEMVKKYKNKYDEMITFILSNFRSFINQFQLKNKITNWWEHEKILQGFVPIVLNIRDDRSNFMVNFFPLLTQLYFQIPTLNQKDLLIDSIEWLDKNGDDVTHWFTRLSHKDSVEIERHGLRPLSVSLIESFIIDCVDVLLPYLKKINESNSLYVKDVMSGGADLYYYFIPYEIVNKIVPSVSEKVANIKEILKKAEGDLPKFYYSYRLSAYENVTKTNRKAEVTTPNTNSDEKTGKQNVKPEVNQATAKQSVKQEVNQATVKQGFKAPIIDK